MLTEQGCLARAFTALLNGDLAARDRWCAAAERARAMRIRVREGGPAFVGEPIKLVEQPDGSFAPPKKGGGR